LKSWKNWECVKLVIQLLNMYLLFDIGGTKMRLANSFDGVNLHGTEVIFTPKAFDKAIAVIGDYISRVDSTHEDRRVCCGLPGVLGKDKEMLIAAPHLSDWVMKPFKKRISEIIHGPIYLENDASLAGLGESVMGAGRGFSIVAFVTVGTGIGGARIVNKRIDVSSYGFEPGHQVIDVDGSLWADAGGKHLELEDCVSGSALTLRYNKNPEQIVEESIWREIEKLLGVGLTNTIVHWSPEVVVLGGGLVQSEHLSIENIQKHVREYLKVFPHLPEIKKGELQDLAGIYGALHFLQTIP